MKKILILLVAISFFTAGCDNGGREEALTAKVDSLGSKLDSLQSNFDELKNSPEYLIGQAHRAYQKAEYERVQEILWQIQKEYPEWNKFLVLEYLGQIAEIIDDKQEPPFKNGDG